MTADMRASDRAVGVVDLFGIPIHDLDLTGATVLINSWLDESARPCRMVVTPNINHAVLLQDDEDFRRAYRKAALTLADGRYLPMAARLLGRGQLSTVNGSDLIPALLRSRGAEGSLSLFLLGAAIGVAEQAAREIRAAYPGVRIAGTYSPSIGFEEDATETGHIVARIEAARPDLLLVGISPPRQEIWVARHLDALNASVVVCGGATIDFLAGHRKRAPRWMQRYGLEWVHRTWTEPARLGPRYAADACRIVPMLFKEWLGKRPAQ